MSNNYIKNNNEYTCAVHGIYIAQEQICPTCMTSGIKPEVGLVTPYVAKEIKDISFSTRVLSEEMTNIRDIQETQAEDNDTILELLHNLSAKVDKLVSNLNQLTRNYLIPTTNAPDSESAPPTEVPDWSQEARIVRDRGPNSEITGIILGNMTPTTSSRKVTEEEQD